MNRLNPVVQLQVLLLNLHVLRLYFVLFRLTLCFSEALLCSAPGCALTFERQPALFMLVANTVPAETPLRISSIIKSAARLILNFLQTGLVHDLVLVEVKFVRHTV